MNALKVGSLVAVLVGLILATPTSAAGQSARPVSIQLSATGLRFDGELYPGAEAQLRFSSGKMSIGFGYQGFSYDDEIRSILFAEPRAVLGAGRDAALYLAGRIGGVLDSGSFTSEVVGGGGGLLFRLGMASALDLGAQFYTTFSGAEPTLQLRVGFSFGL